MPKKTKKVRKSCIRGLGSQHPFSVQEDLVSLNKFFLLGEHDRSRTHIVLFNRTTLDWDTLHVDPETKYSYSPELVQYYIVSIEGIVVGSLFDVNTKRMTLTDTHLFLTDREESQEYDCNNEKGHGGVTVYDDGEGSLLVIPSDPILNEFIVEVNA